MSLCRCSYARVKILQQKSSLSTEKKPTVTFHTIIRSVPLYCEKSPLRKMWSCEVEPRDTLCNLMSVEYEPDRLIVSAL